MEVIIDNKAGFCTGVKRAVSMAEKKLSASNLYCLGQLLHNEAEMKRLEDLGLITIGEAEFVNLENAGIMFRAHGEPPSSFKIAETNSLHITDASCPIVLKVQKTIREIAENIKETKGSIIIYGKKNHPEVKALIAQSEINIIAETDHEAINKDALSLPLHILSQTTMSKLDYGEFCERIIQLFPKESINQITIHNTLCRQIVEREENITAFARNVDVLIFIGGKNSSNAALLFSKCKNANTNSFFVGQKSELQSQWFKGAEIVGVTGASSTPLWQLEEIAEAIENIIKQ